jgi:hypothetical protein
MRLVFRRRGAVDADDAMAATQELGGNGAPDAAASAGKGYLHYVAYSA